MKLLDVVVISGAQIKVTFEIAGASKEGPALFFREY